MQAREVRTLLAHLPSQMSKQSLKRTLPSIDMQQMLAFSFSCVDEIDLPKFDDTKRLKCPGATTIKDVIQFADQKIKFEKFIITQPRENFEAENYIDITMPYIGGKPDGKQSFISFSQDMTLGVIMTFLWPLSKMPGCDNKEAQVQLRYRTLRKKKEMELEEKGGLARVKQIDGDRDDDNVDEGGIQILNGQNISASH